MKCPRCKNEDPRLFGYDNGTWYCRCCIGFSRVDIGETILPCTLSHRIWKGEPVLRYTLTPAQKQCALQVLKFLQQKKDVFVYAATGAGKTEITFESICFYLSLGKKVAFAISRRQVVLEIANRLRQAFPELRVVEVAQDYTSITDGDLIVCTMHQLYRYPYGFDLLILDEVDAFPYAGNALLEQIVNLACKGEKLYLSATPSLEILQQIHQGKMESVTLFQRPHGHPLVIPSIHQGSIWFQLLVLFVFCWRCVHQKKQVLVFVPRRQDCLWLAVLLGRFFKVKGIHAQTKDKDVILESFRLKTGCAGVYDPVGTRHHYWKRTGCRLSGPAYGFYHSQSDSDLWTYREDYGGSFRERSLPVSICQRFGSRVRSYLKADERFCLICNASLNTLHNLYDLELETHSICHSCALQFCLHQKIYQIEQREWHVLYEYNEFLERLLFRYKEQCDRLLAKVFLERVLVRAFQQYVVCGLCSSTQKRYQRGFEPLVEMFQAQGIAIESPFYKNKNHKQSQLSFSRRSMVHQILQKKECYSLPSGPILIVDDVCTSGATLHRALELLDAQKVFVLAAHPLWIQEHQEMTVEKKSLFW